MARKVIVDAMSGEVISIEDVEDTLEGLQQLRQHKLGVLMESYKSTITQGFYSSATGESVFYGYSQQDQLNYSKWANVFALNPNKESIILGSISHGVVSMTKEQFIQFMEDAELYEVTMYQRRKEIEKAIIDAANVDDLNVIQLSF